MNAETKQRITKEAEDKYPMTFYDGTITLDDKLFEVKRKAYIAGATTEAERLEKLGEALEDTKKGLDDFITHTSYNQKLSNIIELINSALNQSK